MLLVLVTIFTTLSIIHISLLHINMNCGVCTALINIVDDVRSVNVGLRHTKHGVSGNQDPTRFLRRNLLPLQFTRKYLYLCKTKSAKIIILIDLTQIMIYFYLPRRCIVEDLR